MSYLLLDRRKRIYVVGDEKSLHQKLQCLVTPPGKSYSYVAVHQVCSTSTT